jgi:hypothetical protein
MSEKNRNGRRGCSGSTLLILVIIAVFAIIVFLGFSSQNANVTIQTLEEGKPVEVYMTSKLPEELRNKHPYALMAKSYNFVTQKSNPADGSWGLIEATKEEMQRRESRQLVTAAPIFKGFQPTIGSAEAGKKVYLLDIGLTGVSERGVEVGNILYAPDYDKNFNPIASSLEIWNIPNCVLRLIQNGIKISEGNCLKSGFIPTSNFIRQGVTEADSGGGIYIVWAYAFGVWVTPLDLTSFGNAVSQSPMANADTETIKNFQNWLNQSPLFPDK